LLGDKRRPQGVRKLVVDAGGARIIGVGELDAGGQHR
jgi:hypothetical protein